MSFGASGPYDFQPQGYLPPPGPGRYQFEGQPFPEIPGFRCLDFRPQHWTEFTENGVTYYKKPGQGGDVTTAFLVSLEISTTLDAVIGGYVKSSGIAADRIQQREGYSLEIYYDGWVACAIHHASNFITLDPTTKNVVLRVPMHADEGGIGAIRGRILTNIATFAADKLHYPDIRDIYVWFDTIPIPPSMQEEEGHGLSVALLEDLKRQNGKLGQAMMRFEKHLKDKETKMSRLSEALKEKDEQNKKLNNELGKVFDGVGTRSGREHVREFKAFQSSEGEGESDRQAFPGSRGRKDRETISPNLRRKP
ncbi:hypothetical protein GE09DRAFT_287954 [Coniochaeta sp. 2T2.1]|nr:hypothetical protein GE09DRAFT_287954 [Coniochaeta sp. 2T2.1]